MGLIRHFLDANDRTNGTARQVSVVVPPPHSRPPPPGRSRLSTPGPLPARPLSPIPSPQLLPVLVLVTVFVNLFLVLFKVRCGAVRCRTAGGGRRRRRALGVTLLKPRTLPYGRSRG